MITRLRFALKLVATSGSQSRVVTQQMSYELRESVRFAYTDPNAVDGVFSMKDTESGVGLHLPNERLSVAKIT